MYKSAWVIKDRSSLEIGLHGMREIALANRTVMGDVIGSMPTDGFQWVRALETSNLMLTAELMLTGALERKESRGLHFILDHPQTDAIARDTVLLPR